jgi:hypothetical protein
MSVLNNIFGSGGILGAVMSIASMVFPPLAIMSSLTNLLTQALGTALKAGIDTLMKEFGMPKFVGDLAKGIIDQVVSANQKQTDPAADKAVQDQAGNDVKAWGTDFIKDFVEKTMEKIKGADKGEGKKATAGSWLEAIALAMADAMTAKAGKMIDLSDKIKGLSNVEIKDGDTNSQKKNAGELQVAQAQLNAAGKEFELLTNTMKSVVDSIGNSLAQAARKS